MTKSKFGCYRLPDGSVIHASKKLIGDEAAETGKFFLWIKDEERMDHGTMRSFGHIEMNSDGPRYFDSPEEAALFREALNVK